ncbi:MAG: hypothetical protein KDA52_07270 [Planctomycetaceae bacterium]|nr:hypothetical protein [Planctomycetaceae bacterium]
MNNESHNWEDLFEQLPLDPSVRPDHQDDLRAKVLQTFETNAAQPSTTQRLKEIGHILMKYKVPHWTAAAILIAGFAWITFSSGTPALALDEVIDNFTKARTARFDMTVMVTGGPEQKMKAFYLEPSHFRQELAGGFVNISDWAKGKTIGLDFKGKKATVMNLVNLPENADREAQMNQFEATRERLRKAVDDPDTDVELLGEQELSGRKVMGFRFKVPGNPMTIWADPDTKFPVQIEGTMVGPPETHVVMSNYEFNVELDESMFSTEIPEGFEITEMDVDVSKPNEEDFIAALRIGSEGSDGQFPPGFDAVAIASYVASMVVKQGFNNEKKPTEAQMQQVIKIGRGLQFALTLPSEADAHYAGATVKYGEKDQPIFWYKPDNSETYRVVYGDLSVKESANAPEVQGATKLSR